MKEKIKSITNKIYKSKSFPYLVYIGILIIIHFFINKQEDDILFSNVLNNNTLFSFLINRYETWSSRIIIETVLVIFCNLPIILWKIANISMFVLLAYSISKLFLTKGNRKELSILLLLILIIPVSLYKSAGWIATCNNYLWVAAAGIYAMIPIKKIIKNEKFNVLEFISFLIAVLYAANQEQMAGILMIVYTIFLLYSIIKKKVRPITVILFTIIICSLLFIVTCPGNKIRNIEEIQRWYPTYTQLNLPKKIGIGVKSMMDFLIVNGRLLFITFTGVLAYGVIKQSKEIYHRILAVIPFILTVTFSLIMRYCAQILDEFKIILLKVFSIELNLERILLIFQICLYITILICIGISLYILFKGKGTSVKEELKRQLPISIIVPTIYCIGLISRIIMGFSPTVYASSGRTSIFLYISMIMIIIEIMKNKFKQEVQWKNAQKVLALVMIFNIITTI